MASQRLEGWLLWNINRYRSIGGSAEDRWSRERLNLAYHYFVCMTSTCCGAIHLTYYHEAAVVEWQSSERRNFRTYGVYCILFLHCGACPTAFFLGNGWVLKAGDYSASRRGIAYSPRRPEASTTKSIPIKVNVAILLTGYTYYFKGSSWTFPRMRSLKTL